MLTYDEQYTDTYVFNELTNIFDLVTDTTATIENVDFTPYTGQEQVELGCTDKPPKPPALVPSPSTPTSTATTTCGSPRRSGR